MSKKTFMIVTVILMTAIVGASTSGQEQNIEGEKLFRAFAQIGDELRHTAHSYVDAYDKVLAYADAERPCNSLADEDSLQGFTFRDDQIDSLLAARRAFLETDQACADTILAYKKFVDAAPNEIERQNRIVMWQRLCEKRADSMSDSTAKASVETPDEASINFAVD